MRLPPAQIDSAELERRQRLVARAAASNPDSPAARKLERERAESELQARIQQARDAVDRARVDRERQPPKLTNPFDPGAPKARWEREATPASTSTAPAPAVTGGHARTRRRRFRMRRWKPRERKADELTLKFARELGWTRERSQALAVRTKKNDAVLAHPRTAKAALSRLHEWSRAAVLRCMRAQGWTLADECARRQVATWATFEDFANPRAYVRPKRFRSSSSGAVSFRGLPKYGLAVVGWTQQALAIALSGAATTDAGADPIDVKTVQRHVALAETYGGLQKVVRNPDAEPELRGLPSDSNPRGWPINVYWLPAPGFMKPGFAGPWFDVDGNPLELEQSLAIELVPRMKRPRRLRELREQAPPPLA